MQEGRVEVGRVENLETSLETENLDWETSGDDVRRRQSDTEWRDRHNVEGQMVKERAGVTSGPRHPVLRMSPDHGTDGKTTRGVVTRVPSPDVD